MTSDKSDKTIKFEKGKTVMNAKQFLSQAYRLNELIKSYQQELAELEALEPAISSPNYSGMPYSGRNPDPPFVRQVIKKVDLERQVRDELNRLIEIKKQIHDAIEGVQNINQRLIFRNRYIEFLTWEQIAGNLGYSLMTVYRMHKEGLKNIVVPK